MPSQSAVSRERYIYIHTHIHTYMHTYIHARTSECQVSLQCRENAIYIHTHIYIHTYIHTYMHVLLNAKSVCSVARTHFQFCFVYVCIFTLSSMDCVFGSFRNPNRCIFAYVVCCVTHTHTHTHLYT
jgi:hypothetical protein